MMISEIIAEYIASHSTDEDELLQEIRRRTYLTQIYPQMLCGPLLGRFLEILVHISKPSRALEIGTFTAYSTICIARALPSNGKLITIEQNDELETMIHKHLQLAQITDKVQLIIGDARQILGQFAPKSFDFIFIDGDKQQYPEYFALCAELLRTGGLLIADNTLWGGKIVDSIQHNDPETKGIVTFNQMVASDHRFDVVMLPLRDGVSLVYKKYHSR